MSYDNAINEKYGELNFSTTHTMPILLAGVATLEMIDHALQRHQ